MTPSELLKNPSPSGAVGAICTCTNRTKGLGVIITEWGIKFIFDDLPNQDNSPRKVNLRDGENDVVQCSDTRCCVGYLSYIKFTWPQGEDVQWVDGKAPAGKCYARFGVGLVPKKFTSLPEQLSGSPMFEAVELDPN